MRQVVYRAVSGGKETPRDLVREFKSTGSTYRRMEHDHAEHYREPRKPLDPVEFIAGLRAEVTGELSAMKDALPELPWRAITDLRVGAIKLTPVEAQPEPRNLRTAKILGDISIRQTQSTYNARTVSIVSASLGSLSSRYRSSRANRSVTPPG